MYPIKRYMKTQKGYVQNLARPEASMVEGYIKEECIGDVTKYLQRFDIVQRRVWNTKEEYNDVEEALEGTGKPFFMTVALRDVAQKYVLQDVVMMEPWLQ